jgi:hypothetical protein
MKNSIGGLRMTRETSGKAKDVVRVQFDFSSDALQRLDNLKAKTDAATRAETVRNALRLYEWFVSVVGPNDTIEVISKDSGEPSVIIKDARLIMG